MSITPPADFWPVPGVITINGITSAVPPLYISANSISIVDATASHSGVVSSASQDIGGVKNFTSGINLNSTQNVSSIETTLTSSDTALPTSKAAKDYTDAHSILTASLPLSILTNNISIADASALASGVVSLGTQSFAGAKTFNDLTTIFNTLAFSDTVNSIRGPAASALYLYTASGGSVACLTNGDVALQTASTGSPSIRLKTGSSGSDALVASTTTVTSNIILRAASAVIGTSSSDGGFVVTGTAGFGSAVYCRNNIIFDKPIVSGVVTISNSIDGQSIRLGGGFSGSSIQTNTGTALGHLQLNLGAVTGSQLKVIDSTSAELLTISPTSMRVNVPLMIDSPAGQIKLGTLISSPTIVATSSDVQINCGTGTLQLNNTPGVSISSGTASSSKITGALVVAGGIASSENVYCQTLIASDDTKSHLHLIHDSSNRLEGIVGKYGDLLLDHIGTTPSTTLAYNATPAHIFTPLSVNLAGTVTVDAISGTVALDTTNGTGHFTIAMDASDDTYITSSGALYINGNPAATVQTQIVVHVLGGAGSGASCTFTYQRVWNQVVVHMSALNHASAGAGAIILATGSEIPLAFRPTYDDSNQMLVINGATNTNGRFVSHTSGALEFWANANTGDFTGSGGVGWFSHTIAWYKA